MEHKLNINHKKVARELVTEMMSKSNEFRLFVNRGCPASMYYESAFCSTLSHLECIYDVRFTSGATRMVIIPWCEDFIIKVDFEERHHGKRPIYYTSEELHIYKSAKSAGLSRYFAQIECIGMIGGAVFYIMEYAPCDEESVEDMAWKYEYGTDHTYSELREMYGYSPYVDDETDGEDALYYDWGDDAASDVISFLGGMVRGSVDIHSGNIGVRNSGEFVLIDYAGYCG